MSILVLGHKGMLGHMVARVLRDLGFQVLITNAKFPTDEFKKDIIDFTGDFIVNCIGAIPQKTKQFEINYELPIWLDTNASCNVVHPGTDCEMDNDLYGLSKLKARDYIVNFGVKTKILKSSIIGPELYYITGLLEWFLSREGQVDGYTGAMWNGNTTYEWTKQCVTLIQNWEKYSVETILEGECLSKFDLLQKVKTVFGKNIHIVESEKVRVDKCLRGDIKTPDIQTQLIELKKYYYDSK